MIVLNDAIAYTLYQEFWKLKKANKFIRLLKYNRLKFLTNWLHEYETTPLKGTPLEEMLKAHLAIPQQQIDIINRQIKASELLGELLINERDFKETK